MHRGTCEGERSEASNVRAESAEAPAGVGDSEGEAGFRGAHGGFSRGLSLSRGTFRGRCSGEVYQQGTKVREREELEMHIWESCLQVMDEGIGVNEIIKGRNIEETGGGGEERGGERSQ